MRDAQAVAELIGNHEAACGVVLEAYDGLGMVCPACRAVVVEEYVVSLPDSEPAPAEADEAQQPGPGTSVTQVGGDVDPITANLSPVDPTRVLTPDEANARIADAVARLERGANFHRACIEEKYAADLDLQFAWARAMNRADGGSADVRKAQATLACEQEITRQSVAEMKVKAVAATMHDLRAMLSGFQSMNKSVTATYQAAGQAYGDRAF